MGLSKLASLLALLGLLAVASGLRHSHGYPTSLQPPEAEEVLKTDGGSIEVWSSDFRPIQDAEIGAALITLEKDGLALPKYSDSADVYYVLEGSARLGLVYPFGFPSNVRRVRKGDFIAIPRGFVNWWYNDGGDRFRVLGVADTSSGPRPGNYTAFPLAGAGKCGSVPLGFSDDLLAEAWDVDEKDVKELLKSQEGSMIVRAKGKKDSVPDTEGQVNDYFGDPVYDLDGSRPEYVVKDGGQFHIVNRFKLPLLSKIQLGAVRFFLEPNALLAPHWSANSHVIMYVTKGSGRVQITAPNGDRLLDLQAKEGDLVIVPRFFAAAKWAGKDGFEWISFTTSSVPVWSFLAGRNSVYKNIPLDVLSASFNVDEDLEDKFLNRRRHDAIIFPPRGKHNPDAYLREVAGSAQWIEQAEDLAREAANLWDSATVSFRGRD